MVRRGAPTSAAAWAAFLGAAVLALAGCGGNGDGEAEPNDVEDNPVAEAAAATLDAGSAHVAYEANFQGPEGPFQFIAEGDVDFTEARSRLVYDMTDLPGTGQEEVEVRFDGADVFVHFPPEGQDIPLPEGSEWIRVPPPEPQADDEEAQPAELDLGGVQQDPTQFLRYLESGATDVQEEGSERVRDEQTTIYTANIDLDQVLEHGFDRFGDDEEEQQAARTRAEVLLEQLGTPIVPVTVNVDAEGLVRRLLLSFDLPVGPRGEPVSVLATTEYYDFGTDVQVEPPPEDLVIDAADVR
jgi:hypothetical protein